MNLFNLKRKTKIANLDSILNFKKVEEFLFSFYHFGMWFIIFCFISSIAYSNVKIEPPVLIDEATNSYVSNIHLKLKEELLNYEFDHLIKIFLYKIDENIYLKAKIYTNKNFLREEEVYTKAPLTEKKVSELISNLGIRILNEENEPFIHEEDRRLKESVSSLTDEEIKELIENFNKPNLFQFSSLFNLGLCYSTGIELSFINLFRVWRFNKFLFGLGTKVLKVYPTLPYETNSAITLFPIEVYVPLFFNEKIDNLFLNFEWGWYKYSVNATNRVNYTAEINYIDLNLKYILPAILFKSGVNYNYLNNNFILYIGLELYVGKYTKE